MIRIEHLKKEYELVTPIKDLSTTIEKGDIIAVIGPSGTGKSTLLRCINRLEEPTSGRIFVDGDDITAPGCKLNAIRQKIGMVFQNFNLYEHLTVVENCMLAQTVLLKKTRQDAYEKSIEMLRLVGMEAWALSYPSKLSGGQKQRVAIARTLCTDPEIILFDEPTSALDPLMVSEVESVIENLAKVGTTMVIVTHSMEFARRISNRVLYLDDGGIYEEGSPEQIFENPKGERTKRFIKRLLSLELEIDIHSHIFDEEVGKIYAFCGKSDASLEKTANVIRCFEEMLSLMNREMFEDLQKISVLVECSKKENEISMRFSSNQEAKASLGEVKDTIEYKLISHFCNDIEEVDNAYILKL